LSLDSTEDITGNLISFLKKMTYPSQAQFSLFETAMENKDGQKQRILVVNTHVTFRDLDGIKSVELFIILKTIWMMKKAHNITEVLLCGDFNLIPYSTLYDFITKRQFDINIHSHHVRKTKNVSFF
jgi:endonuclease/exonuclease/phosphatase family metal-dependent hydrolase